MNEIKNALVTGDAVGVQSGTQTLRGSASIFGAKRVVEFSGRREEFGEAGDLGSARQAMPQLEQHVAELLTVLRDFADSTGVTKQ